MTIHSDWSRVLYEECPEAFTKLPPKSGNQIGFVDGHLQLMRLNARSGSWANFVTFQFVKPLRMLLDSGCKRVVLCFDSYEHVPVYKNMTQTKRTNKHVVPTFARGQELPHDIPDDPMPYLMNRNFKRQVIQMLCDKVPAALELAAGQSLIVDYQYVIEYTGPSGGVPMPVDGMAPMGESDVKFARYVQTYGNALVHAIDGDYLMIALLYYCTNDRLGKQNQIHIYRQLASPFDTDASVCKRSLSGADKALKKPPMCWVNIQLLFCVIHGCMRQSVQAKLIAMSDQRLVRSAVFFMLLAGTDFSRALPLLGPKRLWAYLPNIVCALVSATCDDLVELDILYNGVVGAMYSDLFEKHVVKRQSGSVVLQDVMRQLQSSKLSPTTKSRLPTLEQVLCTLKNIQWVIRYWEMVNGAVDTPLEGENGYIIDKHTSGVVFADAATQPFPI